MRFSFLVGRLFLAFAILLSSAAVSTVAAAPASAQQYYFKVPSPTARIVAGGKVESIVYSSAVRVPRGWRAGIDVELMEQINVDGKSEYRTLVGRRGYFMSHLNKGGVASMPLTELAGDGVLVRARSVMTDTYKGHRVTGQWVYGNIVGIKRPPPVIKPARMTEGCNHTVIPFGKPNSAGITTGYIIMDCQGNRSVRPDAVTITTYKNPWLGGWQKVSEKTRVAPWTRAAQLTGVQWSPSTLVIEVTAEARHIGNLPMRLSAQIDYEQLPHPPLVRAILRYLARADSHVRGTGG